MARFSYEYDWFESNSSVMAKLSKFREIILTQRRAIKRIRAVYCADVDRDGAIAIEKRRTLCWYQLATNSIEV